MYGFSLLVTTVAIKQWKYVRPHCCSRGITIRFSRHHITIAIQTRLAQLSRQFSHKMWNVKKKFCNITTTYALRVMTYECTCAEYYAFIHTVYRTDHDIIIVAAVCNRRNQLYMNYFFFFFFLTVETCYFGVDASRQRSLLKNNCLYFRCLNSGWFLYKFNLSHATRIHII